MTTTYAPQPAYVGEGRPPCLHCGAALRLHSAPVALLAHTVTIAGRHYVTSAGLQKLFDAGGQLPCPVQARVGSLEAAIDTLVAAQRGGDQQRTFAARGDVQRLMGHRPGTASHCAACLALALAEQP